MIVPINEKVKTFGQFYSFTTGYFLSFRCLKKMKAAEVNNISKRIILIRYNIYIYINDANFAVPLTKLNSS